MAMLKASIRNEILNETAITTNEWVRKLEANRTPELSARISFMVGILTTWIAIPAGMNISESLMNLSKELR